MTKIIKKIKESPELLIEIVTGGHQVIIIEEHNGEAGMAIMGDKEELVKVFAIALMKSKELASMFDDAMKYLIEQEKEGSDPINEINWKNITN